MPAVADAFDNVTAHAASLMAGAALFQRAGSAGEYGFDSLQVGNIEPARLVISLKALYAIQANAFNQVNAIFNSVAAQLPVAAGAGGVDIEHVEFQVRRCPRGNGNDWRQ